MADSDQLSFGDRPLSNRRKISKLSKHLYKLDKIIDWQNLVREISFNDKTEKLISYDEEALFGDKAYVDGHHKVSAHHYGWYYGMLDKAKRNQPLSCSRNKRNLKLNSSRAAAEHPFEWMSLDPDSSGKTKMNLVAMRAKTETLNRLRYIFTCIGWNLNRAGFLLEKTRFVGSVA
jgi:transposase, IS5 family